MWNRTNSLDCFFTIIFVQDFLPLTNKYKLFNFSPKTDSSNIRGNQNTIKYNTFYCTIEVSRYSYLFVELIFTLAKDLEIKKPNEKEKINQNQTKQNIEWQKDWMMTKKYEILSVLILELCRKKLIWPLVWWKQSENLLIATFTNNFLIFLFTVE